MICRLSGRLAAVREDAIVLDVGGIGYEVMVPGSAGVELHRCVGQELTLHTVQYFEGNPAGAHLIPRLVGFLSEAEREFFNLFTRVKGISTRRALRAMSLPAAQLAAAIEHGDTHLLTTLPEVGKKTAAQIVAELQGKLTHLLLGAEAAAAPGGAPAVLTQAQRIAVDILVQWGDRRADAQRWVAAAVEADPNLTEPDDIVRAAYRVKQGG
ncbi:MAG: Holliday junction branch migration protein RuvA [Planctomycetota bacterium]